MTRYILYRLCMGDTLMQEQDTPLYGIDWNAPLGTDDDQPENVEVHTTHNPLSANHYSELCELVDPTVYSDYHGLDQYRLAVQFVEDKLSSCS